MLPVYYDYIPTSITDMTATETTPASTAAAQAFKHLSEALTIKGRAAQLEVAAHIRAVTGKHYASIANYHNDDFVTDADKVAMYKHCIMAVAAPGGREKFPLQGSVATGDKRVEEEPTPTMTEARPAVTRKRTQPTVPSTPPPEAEDDERAEDVAAAMRTILAASSKPKVDEAAVRRIVEPYINAVEANIEDTASKLRHRFDSLNIPEEVDIRDVVKKCLSNGEFPESRVQSIVDAAISKAAPTFDLDTHIKPRINELLSGSLKEFMKHGPAALASKPTITVAPPLASSVPDKNSLSLKTYILCDGRGDMLKDVYDRSRSRHGENILIIGPRGCGKTTLAEWFAAQYGLPMFTIDAANLREPRDWFGYKTAMGGDVRWERSQFDLCLEAGNHVILIDEINRTTDQVRNVLMPLLDHRRATFLQERGDYIRVGKGTVFFASANIGFEYTGTSQLDAALDDRFVDRVEVNYLPMDKEADVLVQRTGIDRVNALKLTEIADTVRRKALGAGATLTKTVSTRQLEQAAARFKTLGVSGLAFTLTNHFSAEGGDNSERQQVMQLVVGKFGKV